MSGWPSSSGLVADRPGSRPSIMCSRDVSALASGEIAVRASNSTVASLSTCRRGQIRTGRDPCIRKGRRR